MCTLLQAMMLLDNRYGDYEFASISADETMRYAAYIKNNYSEEQKERLYDIIDYLEKVFPEKDKLLKKINIPVVMLAADTAMGEGYDPLKNIYLVGPMYFRQWFSCFFDECYEEYKQYCSSGSIKKDKTLKRIEIMESSLKVYFDLEDSATAENDDLNNDSVDTPVLPEIGEPSADADRQQIQGEAGFIEPAEDDVPIEQEPAPEMQEENTGHCEDEPEPPKTGAGDSPADVVE